jgi:hypothetical protein
MHLTVLSVGHWHAVQKLHGGFHVLGGKWCRFGQLLMEDSDTAVLAAGADLSQDNQWDQVHDFGWLKQAKSPNW